MKRLEKIGIAALCVLYVIAMPAIAQRPGVRFFTGDVAAAGCAMFAPLYLILSIRYRKRVRDRKYPIFLLFTVSMVLVSLWSVGINLWGTYNGSYDPEKFVFPWQFLVIAMGTAALLLTDSGD